MAQFNFDTQTVEKRESNYELLPAGWYTAQVTESEIVLLKTGNGSALKLTFEVLQEGYRNRKLWARLNVEHSNPTSQKIGLEQLKELCESIGVVRVQDTVVLHNKPMQIRVKIRKNETGQYEDQNDIIAFKPANGAAASAAGFPPIRTAPTASVPPAASAPAAAAPPWAKKAA